MLDRNSGLSRTFARITSGYHSHQKLHDVADRQFQVDERQSGKAGDDGDLDYPKAQAESRSAPVAGPLVLASSLPADSSARGFPNAIPCRSPAERIHRRAWLRDFRGVEAWSSRGERRRPCKNPDQIAVTNPSRASKT